MGRRGRPRTQRAQSSPWDDDLADNERGAIDDVGDETGDLTPRTLLYGEALLSGEEEARLFRAYRRTGSVELRDRLILANTRLAREIAGHYHPGADSGLTTEDLEQEAMFGLMRAVEKFDVERGFKFSTMATAWIKQAIRRAIENQSALIREPSHVQAKRNKARRGGDLAGDGRSQHGGEKEIPPAWMVVSLEQPARGFEDSPDVVTIGELIAASEPAIEEIVTDRALWHSTLYRALGMLSGRERYVIELRYGLATDGDCWTLEKIATAMNSITRERVRQIEAQALRKLRQTLAETSDGEIAVRLLDEVAAARKATQAKDRADRLRRMARVRTNEHTTGETLLAS